MKDMLKELEDKITDLLSILTGEARFATVDENVRGKLRILVDKLAKHRAALNLLPRPIDPNKYLNEFDAVCNSLRSILVQEYAPTILIPLQTMYEKNWSKTVPCSELNLKLSELLKKEAKTLKEEFQKELEKEERERADKEERERAKKEERAKVAPKTDVKKETDPNKGADADTDTVKELAANVKSLMAKVDQMSIALDQKDNQLQIYQSTDKLMLDLAQKANAIMPISSGATNILHLDLTDPKQRQYALQMALEAQEKMKFVELPSKYNIPPTESENDPTTKEKKYVRNVLSDKKLVLFYELRWMGNPSFVSSESSSSEVTKNTEQNSSSPTTALHGSSSSILLAAPQNFEFKQVVENLLIFILRNVTMNWNAFYPLFLEKIDEAVDKGNLKGADNVTGLIKVVKTIADTRYYDDNAPVQELTKIADQLAKATHPKAPGKFIPKSEDLCLFFSGIQKLQKDSPTSSTVFSKK